MLDIRKDSEIWREQGDWFLARWHFSFDRYIYPANDGFGSLRVFNDDRLIPGAIWPMHPHRDVEGITYVVEGTFRHQDNVGGPPGPLAAGSVQRMTLGSGAWHSEQNASPSALLRFIQIWILPDMAGLTPQVEQKVFTTEDRTNRLLEVVSPTGGKAIEVHQDASVFVARLDPEVEVVHLLHEGHGAYVYLISGSSSIDGQDLAAGDSAKVTEQRDICIKARETSELILVDVPMAFEPKGVWAGRAG
jgi:hypothetical protein